MYLLFKNFNLVTRLLPFFILAIGCSVAEDDVRQSSKTLPIIVGGGSGSIAPGADVELSWEVTTDQPSTVFVEVSYDGGKTWYTIRQNVVNSGTTTVSVPDIPGAEFRVRVVGSGTDTVIAESTDISIEGQIRPVLVAGGTSTVTPGQNVVISWEINSDHPDKVDIQQSDDGVTWTTVSTLINNAGSAVYPVTGDAGSSFFIQIVHPLSGLVLARSVEITIGDSIVNGAPGFAITSGGDLIQGPNYKIRATIGDSANGQVLKDNQGRVRASTNLLGVTQ